MCAVRAAGDNHWSGRSARCVEIIVLLSGKLTWIPLGLGRMLWHGVFSFKKLCDAPVSNVAKLSLLHLLLFAELTNM